ncbi:UPF0175 family protein [Candidatus Micrarchaeota archaeon]|nr:UPF0175 family protein [Candidatus Micrarchaeota archaeon]
MSESQAIGIRLDTEFLSKIENLSKAESLDRSTAMRLLMEEGYKEYMKKKAAENYLAGKFTISKAAENAGITIWEMEEFLLKKGFKSQYSVEDLKEELEKIRKKTR